MEREVAYPDIVDKEKIKSDNKILTDKIEYRTKLEITLKNRKKKTFLVIMMNPAEANNEISDETVNQVIDFLKDKAGEIIICNLFPFYEIDSKKLGDLIKKLDDTKYKNAMEKNFNSIKSYIGKVDEIILAYGDCPSGLDKSKHDNVVSELLNNLINKNNIYFFLYDKKVCGISKKGNPYHPSRKTIIGMANVKLKIGITF